LERSESENNDVLMIDNQSCWEYSETLNEPAERTTNAL